MQPDWRKEGESLVCDVPRGETWQALRKGGTAGMYVIIVGLSWWVKAQLAERDPIAWTVVDDLLWVIQEMKKGMAPFVSAPQKRVHGDDKEDEKVPSAKRM